MSMTFSRKAKATSNAPRVTDDEELPSGEAQHSRVVQPNAAETSTSSPTGEFRSAARNTAARDASSGSGM